MTDPQHSSPESAEDIDEGIRKLRAHVKEGGKLSHRNGLFLLEQVERPRAPAQCALNYGKMSVDMAIEACAKIAEPWAGYWLDENSTDADRAVVRVRSEIAAKIRALSVSSTVRDRGSGYSNHPDSGEVCQACKGQGEVTSTDSKELTEDQTKLCHEIADELRATWSAVPRPVGDSTQNNEGSAS